MQNKQIKPNSIVALSIVSESEIAMLFPEYDGSYKFDERPDFNKILFSLGVDTSQRVEVQDNLQHRNRLNQVVICRRYVGQERLDAEWLTSGYASREALDKASGSRLMEDVYRAKGLTQDMQDRLEARDIYSIIDESVQG
jgi:hypothetical protein